MEPPEKLSFVQFRARVKAHCEEHYVKDGDLFRCKECTAAIRDAVVRASIHYAMFGDTCAGSGEVKTVNVPYCPVCEREPKKLTTCIHI